jgi:hypothetical protein
MLCFSLLLIFWRGNTSIFTSLIIFFGGCASGMANSSLFVAVTAGVGKEEMAIATTGLYLSSSVSIVAGVGAVSVVFRNALREYLGRELRGVEGGDEVCLLFFLCFVHLCLCLIKDNFC